ncbi:WD40-repeat-containing domain [Pseudocohnilembus persalinus]|uniref:WD40-repeat-containing domain n=1 Tax=Pseudocohnilembus persalinus TaxID=266149 RepID=A0A0V0QZJ6_PSEPJ|nr:WD40-repeat-containing domain [Pseudocohnilembus persalinus]|eukprot:KRX07727.1 WD40-repeat-containing domain [Pseudocohnilembus persalinus]
MDEQIKIFSLENFKFLATIPGYVWIEELNNNRHILVLDENCGIFIYDFFSKQSVNFVRYNRQAMCCKIIDKEQRIYGVAGDHFILIIQIQIDNLFQQQGEQNRQNPNIEKGEKKTTNVQEFNIQINQIKIFDSPYNICSLAFEFQPNNIIFAIYGTIQGSLIKFEVSDLQGKPVHQVYYDKNNKCLNMICISQLPEQTEFNVYKIIDM